MTPKYELQNSSDIFSPSLLFYKGVIQDNINKAITLAQGPERLRPHVKTHKTREIALMQLAAGIVRHKCATLAEAEMLATCSVPDVLIAYPMVGPNISRLVRLIQKYPSTRFSVLVDHPLTAKALSLAMSAQGQWLDVLMDVDVGQHRTGVSPGPIAIALYKELGQLTHLTPAGFHVYDGHNHQSKRSDREAAVHQLMAPVLEMRTALEQLGYQVPRLVCGGTPTFPVYASLDIPGIECSPGTFVLDDANTANNFADLDDFTPAALLLTRVVSKPTRSRLTLDLGYKAVASDPPAGKRCNILNIPEYQAVLQNEEHLVIETPLADRYAPGDILYAVPAHICPTCAMHRFAYVVEDGLVTQQWEIVARDRVLTI